MKRLLFLALGAWIAFDLYCLWVFIPVAYVIAEKLDRWIFSASTLWNR